ncbi:MAG TPA: hypothetical protein VJN91_03605 [Gammaproteobacteria bacterium]|nr:hypothetical protein [Gammaproteobacteria bacterium]
MHPVILELNDHEIRIARDAEIILRSPGYALVNGGEVILGEGAVRQSRLRPRSIYDQFWDRLNQDPLKNPAGSHRHHADLAYSHLLDMHARIGKPEQFLFAVPGKFSNTQLALLLGLAEAAPFAAAGLVDLATAAIAAVADEGEYLHIDIHLHNAVLTQVTVTDCVRRGGVQVIAGAGMSAIIDSCAYALADLFIQQSRFDPQHLPETEQELYNQIPACLAALSSTGEYLMHIAHGQVQHQVWIDTAALTPALEKHYQRIRGAIPPDRGCLLSDRAAGLPSFAQGLSDARTLEETDTFLGCLANLAEICQPAEGKSMPFITSLPRTETPRIHQEGSLGKTRRSAVSPSRPGVTHVLYQGQAWPLANGPLHLSAAGGSPLATPATATCTVNCTSAGAEVRSPSGNALVINGKPAPIPAQVAPGDKLTFPDTDASYTFISVTG